MLAFYIVCGIPFFVYSCWKLWQYKAAPLMQKRYPLLLFATAIFLFLMLSRNVLINLNACILQIYCNNIPYQVEASIQALILIPMVMIFTTRVFFLWFDLKWNERISNLEWWKHINQKEASWFIKHKQTIGSFNDYMSKYLFIGFIFYMILFIILVIVADDDDSIETIETLFVRIPIIISLFLSPILLCCMPESDTLNIRHELSIIIIIWDFACIYFSITESMELQKKYQFMVITTSIMNIITEFGVTYLTILYPINSFMIIKPQALQLQIHQNSSDSNDWATYICQSSDNFNRFMSFLVKEIAIENLCFLLEICQLKKQYYNNTGNHLGFYLQLPDDLPTSSIIHQSADLDKKMVLLYDKYIDDAAQLQLNISYCNKQAIALKLEKLKESEKDNSQDLELLLLYEDILIEVQQLLQNSWIRFHCN